MKQTIEMQIIQDRMKPGIITLDGFLGNDKRNLNDIIEEDDAFVKRENLTHIQIAERMKHFRDEGAVGLGHYLVFENRFQVIVETYRGKLVSPFDDHKLIPKTNTTLANLKLYKEITYTDLNIHMIEKYGFYQGKGSKYRIDPKIIIEILEIK